MEQPGNFALEAVSVALAKMFEPTGWYDICTVDAAIKALNVIPNQREYNELRVLHCVHWSQMRPEMRLAVAERTINLFREAGLDAERLLAPILNRQRKVPQRSGIKAFLLGPGT